MRSNLVQAGLVAVLLVGSACYHAQIETGALPSDVVVRNDMATGWLWGLIPPKVTNVASQCPTGVSRVETTHSFVNGLLNVLTGGIFTPMTIIVTCAKAGTAMTLPGDATVVGYDPADPATLEAAIQEAAATSRRAHHPVYLQAR